MSTLENVTEFPIGPLFRWPDRWQAIRQGDQKQSDCDGKTKGSQEEGYTVYGNERLRLQGVRPSNGVEGENTAMR